MGRHLPVGVLLALAAAWLGGCAKPEGGNVLSDDVRLHDVRDLVVEGPGLLVPSKTLSGAGGFFTHSYAKDASAQERRQVLANALIGLIKGKVAPGSWGEVGEAVGAGGIREENGRLIVRQTLENQDAVARVLADLRKTRAIQVGVESRLMVVSDDFLNDIRVGWDLRLPMGEQTASASIIDNWTLNKLLQGVQTDGRAEVVNVSRVSIANGRSGRVHMSRPATTGAATRPTVVAAATATFNIFATVSVDRRYVVLSFEGIDVKGVQEAVGTAPAIVAATLPAHGALEIGTMVSVPDGGTLLIGVRPIPGDAANRMGLLVIQPQIMVPDTQARAAIYEMSHGPSPKPFGLP